MAKKLKTSKIMGGKNTKKGKINKKFRKNLENKIINKENQSSFSQKKIQMKKKLKRNMIKMKIMNLKLNYIQIENL